MTITVAKSVIRCTEDAVKRHWKCPCWRSQKFHDFDGLRLGSFAHLLVFAAWLKTNSWQSRLSFAVWWKSMGADCSPYPNPSLFPEHLRYDIEIFTVCEAAIFISKVIKIPLLLYSALKWGNQRQNPPCWLKANKDGKTGLTKWH